MNKQEQPQPKRVNMDRGILAIILVCISVIAASCGTGNDYSKDIGTAPGAQTQFCTPQTAQRGEQPSPTAVNPHPVPPSEAMFGFDAQHTSYNPYERTLTPTNVSKLVLKWTAPTAKPLLAPGLSSPTVANGVVYAASNDGKLYAFNATTGAVLWSTCIGNTDATPAVVNGVVYIGSGDGKLYALNADTGAVLWSVIPNPESGVDIRIYATPLGTPAVANGIVYVNLGNFKVFAYHLPG